MSRPNRRGNIALNWVKLVALFILAGFGIEVLKYIVLGNFISASNRVYRARNSEAKTQVATLNRFQEFFYLEKDGFANTIDALGNPIKTQTEYFNYSLQVGENAVFNYGMPRTDIYEMASWGFLFWKRSTSRTLKSYVGECLRSQNQFPKMASNKRYPCYVNRLNLTFLRSVNLD
uniref:Type IV pilin-like G/H family protein n=1 Tax=Desertifilum tharense IPPAS B-1220 TaxID=1781255 RepID=A0ACD5GNQ3_9CYAN